MQTAWAGAGEGERTEEVGGWGKGDREGRESGGRSAGEEGERQERVRRTTEDVRDKGGGERES